MPATALLVFLAKHRPVVLRSDDLDLAKLADVPLHSRTPIVVTTEDVSALNDYFSWVEALSDITLYYRELSLHSESFFRFGHLGT